MTSETEEWRVAPGYPFHEVSSEGRVRRAVKTAKNTLAGKLLNPSPEKDGGYLRVSLDGKRVRIHQLVALAFHSDTWFDGAIVCHKDDVPSNNRADNLYWGTLVDNGQDASKNGRLAGRSRAKYDQKED